MFDWSQENEKTKKLRLRIKKQSKHGYLVKSDLEEICRWKAARIIRIIRCNRENKIKKITLSVLRTKNDREKISSLIKLKGVGVPMASAILMFINPTQYGVIDKRVWEVLFKLKEVKRNPEGNNLKIKDWEDFIAIIRPIAKRYRVRARDIERTIFDTHKEYMQGNLYH